MGIRSGHRDSQPTSLICVCIELLARNSRAVRAKHFVDAERTTPRSRASRNRGATFSAKPTRIGRSHSNRTLAGCYPRIAFAREASATSRPGSPGLEPSIRVRMGRPVTRRAVPIIFNTLVLDCLKPIFNRFGPHHPLLQFSNRISVHRHRCRKERFSQLRSPKSPKVTAVASAPVQQS